MRTFASSRLVLNCNRPLAWFVLSAYLIFPGLAKAALPMQLFLVQSSVGQAETGTIKGRLVYGDEKIPEIKVDVAKGTDTKNPDVCAKNASIMSRELVVDAKTKGVAYGFAFLSKPKGDSTAQVPHCWPRIPKSCWIKKGASFSLMCSPSTRTRSWWSSPAIPSVITFGGWDLAMTGSI